MVEIFISSFCPMFALICKTLKDYCLANKLKLHIVWFTTKYVHVFYLSISLTYYWFRSAVWRYDEYICLWKILSGHVMNIFSKGRVFFYSMARQWYHFYCGPFKVSRNGSFWVCEVSSLQEVNISFEPEFGNSSFETQDKHNVFNFQLTWFSAVVDFIFWFCTNLSSKTWSFELISLLLLFDAQLQRKVFEPSFSKLGF